MPIRGHGRIEQRLTQVFTPPADWLPIDWQSLIAAVIRVDRQVQKPRPDKATPSVTVETAYYICTTLLSAKHAASAIRGHWAVENQFRYVRDVTFKEDACQVYTRPGILARMRSLALNILYHNNVHSIAEAIYRNTLCFDSLIQLKGL